MTVPEVDAAEGKARVDAGALLLDVREPNEWEAGHAPGATFIPLGSVPDRVGDLPAGQTVVVICRSGGRSARATEFLRARGVDAVNLAGGMRAWAAEGFTVETDDGSEGVVA